MTNKMLWSEDAAGERWLGALENPYLAIANPPHHKGRKKGVYPKALAHYWATHKRKGAKRNPPAAVARATPAGTVEWIKAGASRGKKRASGFLSKFPDGMAVAGVLTGVVVPGLVVAQARPYIPSTLMDTPLGYWAVKVAAAILPSWLVKRFISAAFGAKMMIGGLVGLGVEAIRTYWPAVLGAQPMLGYYTSGTVTRALASGASRQLGAYTPPNAYPATNPASRMTVSTPTRLQPQTRF